MTWTDAVVALLLLVGILGIVVPILPGTILIGSTLLVWAILTGGGLIFIGASMDSRVRALDIRTGEVLWKALVSAPAVALPAVYQHEGRQYVVFAAGGDPDTRRTSGLQRG